MLLQNILAGKIAAFVSETNDAQARFERRALGGKIVAVERQAGFQPQRVARAEAARFQAERLARFEQREEKVLRDLVGEENFQPVLAGVAGPRGQEHLAIPRVAS